MSNSLQDTVKYLEIFGCDKNIKILNNEACAILKELQNVEIGHFDYESYCRKQA